MARTSAIRTGVSVALAAFLVATAIVVIPGAQALSVLQPLPDEFAPFVTVGVEFNDPELSSLEGLVLHFDCEVSGKFSEPIGTSIGAFSEHAIVSSIQLPGAGGGYGYLQVSQTGYGYYSGQHGYASGTAGVRTGYGYDYGYGYDGAGYGYHGYGYGYDSGTMLFVFEMVQAAFIADESCTLVVEIVPAGSPSGDFESPRSAPFIPRMSPLADAGETIFAVPGSLVTLDGTLSIDPNDGPEDLNYTWEQEGGAEAIDLDGIFTAEPTFIVPDVVGESLLFNLTVFDGLDSDWDRVLVNVRLVTAPADGFLLEGDIVPLVGGAAPGLSVEWTVVSGAPGGFTDNEIPSTTFQAPEVDDDTAVTLRITGTDGVRSGFDEVTFIVRDNEAPVSDAGDDLPAIAGLAASLDGSGSYDPDGDQMTYAWSIVDAPAGVALLATNTAVVGVSIPASTPVQVATFLLIVSDPYGGVGYDTVDLVIQPPGAFAAKAGPDQDVLQGSTVKLSGDGSTGVITAYAWTTDTQDAPAPVPTADDLPNATFVASTVGQFTYRLTVTGPSGTSFDEVVVTVRASGSGAPQEWFLHTTGCLVGVVNAGIPTPPTDTLTETDTPGDDNCVRLALDPVQGAVDFTATATRAVPAGSIVTGDLYISVLLPDGSAGLLPPFDGVDVDVSLVKGATTLGSQSITGADVDTVAFGLVPDGGLTYTKVSFSFPVGQGGLAESDAFALRLVVGPTGIAYTIGLEGVSASSFIFPASTAALGAPVANAGPNQQVPEGTLAIQLDGSASSDAEGTIASYNWTQVGGLPVTLLGHLTATPTFNAPAVFITENLHFRLVVTDNDGLSSNADDVRITIVDAAAGNDPPVALAGADKQVAEGTLVTLTGAASDDADDFIQVRWTQPDGTPVGGLAAGLVRGFFAPRVTQATDLTFRWTVRDNHGAITNDEVVVRVVDVPGATPSDPNVIVVSDDTPADPSPTDPAPTTPPSDPAPTNPAPTQPGPTQPGPVQETDTDGDGVPDRIEIALGTNPNFAGDLPSFDITETLTVRNVDGVNVLSWPVPENALGVQVWSSNSPYVLVATLDADETSYEDPDGRPTTKYKLTYFIERTKAGGFLADASELASLPGWNEASATTLSATPLAAGSSSPGRGLPLWAFMTVLALAISIVVLLGVIALRERRKA